MNYEYKKMESIGGQLRKQLMEPPFNEIQIYGGKINEKYVKSAVIIFTFSFVFELPYAKENGIKNIVFMVIIQK